MATTLEMDQINTTAHNTDQKIPRIPLPKKKKKKERMMWEVEMEIM